MTLHDPIAAYNAESNIDAVLAQRFLQDEGIEAFVSEDNSLVGYLAFGTLPEIHKPQVWVHRADAERAGQLLAEYERHKWDRNAEFKENESKPLDVQCEKCNRVSSFAGSLAGSVQNCPHGGAYLDVGDLDWPCDVESEESGNGANDDQ